MGLITDNQRKTAQESESQLLPVPKLPRAQEPGDLKDAPPMPLTVEPEPPPLNVEAEAESDSLKPGEYIEFSAGSSQPIRGTAVEPGQGFITGLMQGQLGSPLPELPLPAVGASSTPPLTSLWKDARTDLGIPNLGDNRIVEATYPALFSNPLSAFDPGLGRTFATGATVSAQAQAQAEAERKAVVAQQVQRLQEQRGALPNVPDASKPWHEQLWGWANDFLQGTKQEQATEQRTGKGTFGAYGSGLGGFLKSVFGVPIAVGTAAALETWGRDKYYEQKRLLGARNVTVRTERITKDGARMSVELPFNSLSAEEKHKYLTEVVSASLPLGMGNLIKVSENTDFRKAFGTYIYQALAGEVDDSINNANPKLAPVLDRRTNKPAQVERPRGFFQSVNKRPGQEWYEDAGGAALELGVQLFSPGNKVDAGGELLGLGLRTIVKTKPVQQLGRAVVNAVPKPVKQAVGTVAQTGSRTLSSIKAGNFGSSPATPNVAPISRPTPVVGLPQNNRQALLSFSNEQANLAAALAQQKRTPVVWKEPSVPDVPNFEPTTAPVLPKTDPEGLAAVVGIGQKGQPLTFEPTVELRTHQQFVQQLQQQDPAKFGSYKGQSWEEWEQWKQANLSAEDLRQFEAVGAVSPTKLEQTPTLDDLRTQARVLTEQKLSLEAPLKQLEQVFDETVDLGRRAVDELPLRQLTLEDLQNALSYGSSVRLSRQLPSSVVEAAARGDTKALEAQAQAIGGLDKLVDAHNKAIGDLTSLITPEVVAKARLATDLPSVVYHGTALEQWQPYNVVETGSRGELGSGLYTTRSYEEAAAYSQASVGNNRPPEVAYDPLRPQVVELSTSKVQAPLDARLTLSATDDLVQAVVKNLPANVRPLVDNLPKQLTFADLSSRLEVAAAQVGGGEQVLKGVSDSVTDTLRASGYDAVYDSKSGWLEVIDNGKLDVVKQTYNPEPSPIQAAVARYNADSLAAGHYPEHLTSDANLRDSSFQVLDQARTQLDERLEEVQDALVGATYKENEKPLLQQAVEQSFDTLRARVKEPPTVERYQRDIQEFGQPLHPVLVREYAPDKFELVGNAEAFVAALASFHPRDYTMVAAMVQPPKQRVAGVARSTGYYLVDIRSINKRALEKQAIASTKQEVMKEFNAKVPSYTSAPVVLEKTSFGSFRVLDRGYTANAYSSLYKKGKKGAELVPAIVVGGDGKAEFSLVDLSAIEKKAKALETEVPKLEEVLEPTKKAQTSASPFRDPNFDISQRFSPELTSTLKNLSGKKLRKFAKDKYDVSGFDNYSTEFIRKYLLRVDAERTQGFEMAEGNFKYLTPVDYHLITGSKTNRELETDIGKLIAPDDVAEEAKVVLDKVLKNYKDNGIELPDLKAVVFYKGGDNTDFGVFRWAKDYDKDPEIGGFFADEDNVLLINARQLDKAEGNLTHELMHTVEWRSKFDRVKKAREFIKQADEQGFLPSGYGFENQAEYMAESARILLGDKGSPEIKQKFVEYVQSLGTPKPFDLGRKTDNANYLRNYRRTDTLDKLIVDVPEKRMLAEAEDLYTNAEKQAIDEAFAKELEQIRAEAEDQFVDAPSATSNPHASLTDALDEAQNGRYDICDF
jgi:hypothetical protein